MRPAWERSRPASHEPWRPGPGAQHGHDFEYTAKIRTLAETERFFDELTKEKDQVKTTKHFVDLFLNLTVVSQEQSEGSY